VWDYAGDNYVHRLIMNKTDGKLVELPPHHSSRDASASGAGKPSRESNDDGGGTELDPSKVDSLVQEFDYLLTSQLESQRLYFEARLERAELEYSKAISSYEAKLGGVIEENGQLREEVQELEKEKGILSRTFQDSQRKIAKLRDEDKFLRDLNDSLTKNQLEWKKTVARLEAEVARISKERDEYMEESRDLLLHFEAQSMLALDPEMAGANLEGVVDPAQSAREAMRGRRRRR